MAAQETRSPSVTPPPVRPRLPSLSDSVNPQQKLELEPPEPDARAVPSGFAPERAIDEQIADLERWAEANVRGDRRQAARFWVLRGLEFTSVIATTASGALGYGRATVVAGVVAALAIAIDAAWTGVNQRDVQRRAVHDLRELQNAVKLRWDKVRLAYPDTNAPKRVAHALALLDMIQAKREEIGKYLGSAAPSPGVTRQLS